MARLIAVLAPVLGAAILCAQQPAGSVAELSGRVVLPAGARKPHPPAVVVWLTAVDKTATLAAPPPGKFALVQRNRMFTPHLLVIPAGSMVSFPNEDPFFHNVFSLFNGKRFD